MDRWSRDETRFLISLYKQQPCLYDPKHEDYLKKPIRLNALNFIKRELNEIKPGITIPAIKKKIKTLLSQISREKNNMRKFSESEISKEAVYKTTWWCFKELQFLLHINGASAEKSDLSVNLSESSDTPKRDQPAKRQHASTLHGSQLLSGIKETMEIAKSLHANSTQKTKEDAFGEMLALELMELKFEENYECAVKTILQRIYDVKYKERRLHYEEASRKFFQENGMNQTVNEPSASSSPSLQILTLEDGAELAENDTNDNIEFILGDEDIVIKTEISE